MPHTAVTKEELVDFLSNLKDDIIIAIGDDAPMMQDINEMLDRCALDEED